MPARKKEEVVVATAAPVGGMPHSYLEWGPTIGGGLVAVALSMVLGQFGAGIGLSLGDPVLEGDVASWNVLVAGLWVIWMALASSAAGGYLAGRMRHRHAGASEAEVEFRDGIHGLVVWGLATILAGVGIALISALSAIGAAAAEPRTLSDTALRIAGNASTIFAFATAAGSILGAGAAWWAATLGGEHRDEGTDVHMLVPEVFRKYL